MYANSQVIPVGDPMKNPKLRRKYWKYTPEINPEYVRYQRIQGNVGAGGMAFRSRNITPNSLLLSKAYIKWSFAVDKVKNAAPPVPANFSNSDQIFAKPNILENCMKRIQISINGYNIGTYDQPKYWAKYLTRSFQNDNLLFTTDGGRDPDYNGAFNEAGLPAATDPLIPAIGDRAIRESLNVINGDISVGQPTSTFNFTSLLNFGLFNKYYGDTKRSYLGWHMDMSEAIPYVKDLGVNIEMDNISTNALNYMFGLTTAALFEDVELVNGRVTSAELVLQWIDSPSKNIEPSKDYFGESVNLESIPEEVLLQSYSVRFNKFNIGQVTQNTLFTLPPTPSTHMSLYSIPDYFLIFATVDKDSASYRNISNIFASDNAGANAGSSNDINANESNMNFEQLTIRTNVSTQIINTEWNEQELYNLTMSNSKKGYPFTSFAGGGKYLGIYPSNAYILVKPSDIGIKKSSGQSAQRLSLQFEGLLRARDGNAGLEGALGGDKNYILCVALIYSNYYVYLNKDGMVNTEYSGEFV